VPDQNDDQPRPRDFASVLIEHSGGETHDALSDALHRLLAAVDEHGRKGSMTITLTAEPSKFSNGALAIAVAHTVKPPAEPPATALFFLDADGNPTRNDPRQPQLDFREATPATDPATLRSVHQ